MLRPGISPLPSRVCLAHGGKLGLLDIFWLFSMLAAFGSGAVFSVVSGFGGPNLASNALSTGIFFALVQGGLFKVRVPTSARFCTSHYIEAPGR